MKGHELLGSKDYTETPWCDRLEDLDGGKQGTPPKEALKAADYKGKFRKNSCTGSGMGLKVYSPMNVDSRPRQHISLDPYLIAFSISHILWQSHQGSRCNNLNVHQ